jgi:hypothetical protein
MFTDPCSIPARIVCGQAATAGLLQTAQAHGHEFAILSKPLHPADLLDKLRALALT